MPAPVLVAPGGVVGLCGKCGEKVEEGQHCALCERALAINRHREGAAVAINEQADRMIANSSKQLPPLAVGDNVIVPIPPLDRGVLSARNSIGVVMAAGTHPHMYVIGTPAGQLERQVVRGEIDKLPTKRLKPDNVPDKKLTLRSAAAKACPFGGQGFRRCQCKGECNNKRCSCKFRNVLCNSHCHSNRTCKNKHAHES